MVPKHLTLVALAVAACAAFVPAPARAGSDGWTVHIRGRHHGGDHVLDLALPWSSDEHGNVFDFADDDINDMDAVRLRAMWEALRHVPEGSSVTMRCNDGSVRAHFADEYLVLEPQPRNDEERSRIEVRRDVVQAMVEHGGRLSDADVARLVRAHGRLTLVRVLGRKGDLEVWLDDANSD